MTGYEGTLSLIWAKMADFYERRKEMFYLTTHSTHFIYGCMASDIWKRTNQIVREETNMGYSFSRGALAGTRNSSMGPFL